MKKRLIILMLITLLICALDIFGAAARVEDYNDFDSHHNKIRLITIFGYTKAELNTIELKDINDLYDVLSAICFDEFDTSDNLATKTHDQKKKIIADYKAQVLLRNINNDHKQESESEYDAEDEATELESELEK